MAKLTPRELRLRRHYRLRNDIRGTPGRPRLNVFRSNQHIYAQIIDDEQGHTIISASTVDTGLRDGTAELKGIEQARAIGKAIAERARQAGITKVVFDRGGYRYHGRVQALADGAREGGLEL